MRQLEWFFHFDDRDRERIADRRGDHNRLGFAVQLAITDPECLVRYA
ncbi:MAG: DUF4158 domain-containing protein [Actinomycetota bacterium]|nr:DUF4158 domain-containing protein [Actinomycetota bacterium]